MWMFAEETSFQLSINTANWTDDYDMYGGLGIAIDFNKYQKELKDLGLR